MIIFNRGQEFLDRATERSVKAIIHLASRSFQDTFDFHARLSPEELPIFKDDVCNPAVAHDPGLLKKILGKAASRNRRIVEGGLTKDEKEILFNSEDLVMEATGIPEAFEVLFDVDPERRRAQIAGLPFPSLAKSLLVLDTRLEVSGEAVQGVKVEHGSIKSAFDYYKIATKSFSQGHGQDALGRPTTNLAEDILQGRGQPPVILH